MVQLPNTASLLGWVQELRRVAEEELRAVEDELQREAREDADLRTKYGQRWTRPASVALNTQISEKIAGELSHWAHTPCSLHCCSPFQRAIAMGCCLTCLSYGRQRGMQGSRCRKKRVADCRGGQLQGTGQIWQLRVTATSAWPSACRRTQGRWPT